MCSDTLDYQRTLSDWGSQFTSHGLESYMEKLGVAISHKPVTHKTMVKWSKLTKKLAGHFAPITRRIGLASCHEFAQNVLRHLAKQLIFFQRVLGYQPRFHGMLILPSHHLCCMTVLLLFAFTQVAKK